MGSRCLSRRPGFHCTQGENERRGKSTICVRKHGSPQTNRHQETSFFVHASRFFARDSFRSGNLLMRPPAVVGPSLEGPYFTKSPTSVPKPATHSLHVKPDRTLRRQLRRTIHTPTCNVSAWCEGCRRGSGLRRYAVSVVVVVCHSQSLRSSFHLSFVRCSDMRPRSSTTYVYRSSLLMN